MHFYGPGFKSLENALRSYMYWIKYVGDRALAINPNTGKWHVIIVTTH